MAKSNPVSINDTASSIVLSLPELLSLIGHHLPHSDLTACIQVSRTWNEILIPVLWHTVDTNNQPWTRLVSKDGSIPSIKTAAETDWWAAQVLKKYGCYIRHLTVQWDVVLRAAVNPCGGGGKNGACTRLRTLIVGDIKEHLRERLSLPPGVKSPPMPPIPPFPPTPTTRAVVGTGVRAGVYNFSPPPIPPIPPFPPTPTTGAGVGTGVRAGVYNFSPPPSPLPFYLRASIWTSRRGIDNHGENLFRRFWVGHFWDLVQQNPELTKITFPDLATMGDTSTTFVFANLQSVKSLKELDVTRTYLDMGILLSSVPQLERLKGYALTNIYSLEQEHAALRSLDLSPSCAQIGRLLCMMVKCLPGLEELRFKNVTREPSNNHLPTILECPAFPPLRRLFIDEATELDDEFVALFVGRLPGLLQIQIQTVFAKTEKALWDSCYLLEEVHGDNAPSMDAWKERRAKSVSGCGRTDKV